MAYVHKGDTLEKIMKSYTLTFARIIVITKLSLLQTEKTSKRVPLRKKYKILKKVREHNRKKRREERKNPKKVGKKKVVHIPNLCPFKEEMLKEMILMKEKKEEEKKARKEAWKLERQKMKEAEAAQKTDLNSIVEDAEMKQRVHLENQDENVFNSLENENKTQDKKDSMQKFFREFKKVVAEANVILQVLDARDPIGTRSKRVESCVLQSADKRLVLVLNKADLIPQENLKKWLKYFQQYFPTVPFKASTQQQKRNLSQRKKFRKLPHEAIQGSNCVGADLLMSLLGNYCRNNDIKRAITVGVVGMPNVGKSSIINSLKRSRSCGVGAIPGFTKKMQEVQLDSKIKLLDCPGVVYPENVSDDYSRVALKNAARAENLIDPIGAATAILIRVNKEQMKEQYKLKDYSTADEFFCVLAKRYGFLKKGGIADAAKAAKVLIDDWNRGRIKHYTEPPEIGNEVHIDAQIVQTMAKEFDIGSFETMETDVIQSLENPETKSQINSEKTMEVESEDVQKAVEIGAAVENTDLISESVIVEKSKKLRWKKKKKEVGEKPDSQLQLEGNQKLNNQKKLEFKKLKKEKSRRVRDTSKLADTLSSISLGARGLSNDDYDFEKDLKIK